jgi:hypothetical protein
MEQLFSQSVRTLLEGVARGEDPEEYRRTVTAIKEETEELVAEAKARRMNKTEAHIVLGLRPDAEAEEINRTCRCLFELWRPADSGDESAVQRTDEVKRAQAFLKEQGRA